MARLPDIGLFSIEQTKELAVQALSYLTLTDRIAVIMALFPKDSDDAAELLSWLED